MLIEELSSKRKREKMKEERKKGEQKFALSFFCARKNGDCSRKFRRHQYRTQAMTARSAAQTASPPKTSRVNVVFRFCPTNFTVRLRKTTTISTTCTYYREILTVRALRSSRTIEYYVLLSLRTIEKRKDWI